MRIDQLDDIVLDMARLEREALTRCAARMSSQQLGEAFIGIDGRRRSAKMRGEDRRLNEHRTRNDASGTGRVPLASTQRNVAHDES